MDARQVSKRQWDAKKQKKPKQPKEANGAHLDSSLDAKSAAWKHDSRKEAWMVVECYLYHCVFLPLAVA